MRMRVVLHLLALVIVTALGSISANATTIYSQGLNPNGDGGSFSHPGQQIADRFRLAGNASLTDLVWYGDNLSNAFAATRSFTIRLFADATTAPASTPFVEQAVTASVVDTGLTIGGEIFRFSASLGSPVALNGGTDYWLSVLDASGADVSHLFRWAPGLTTNVNDLPNTFRGSDASPWVPDLGVRTQAAYDLLGGTAAPVPEPTTLLLLGSGLGALGAWARHRRN